MRAVFFIALMLISYSGISQTGVQLAEELGFKVSMSKGQYFLQKDKKKEGPYDSFTVRHHKATLINKDGQGIRQQPVNESFLLAWINGSFTVRSRYINASSLTYFEPSPIVFDALTNWAFSQSPNLHYIEQITPSDLKYETSRALPALYQKKEGCLYISTREYQVPFPPVCGVDAIIWTPKIVGINFDEKGRKTFHRITKLRMPGGPVVSAPYDSVFTAYEEMVGCINKDKGTVEFFIQDSLFLKGDIARIEDLTSSARAMEIAFWEQRDLAYENEQHRKDSVEASIWKWYAGLTLFAGKNGGIGLKDGKGDTLLPAAASSLRMFGYIYTNEDGKVKPALMYGEKGEDIVFWADNKLRLKKSIGKEELRVEFYPVDRKTGLDVGYFFTSMTPSFNFREVYPGTGTCGRCNGEKTVIRGTETESRYRATTETVKTGTATSVKKYSERTVTDANGKTYNYTPVVIEEKDLYKTQTNLKKETYSVEKKVACPRCNGTGDINCLYLQYDSARNIYIYFPKD